MKLTYHEAFEKLHNEYQEQIFDDVFLFYSMLLDYVSYSIQFKKLARIYYLVETRLEFHLLINKENKKTLLDILANDYNKYDYCCSIDDIIECVKPLVILDKIFLNSSNDTGKTEGKHIKDEEASLKQHASSSPLMVKPTFFSNVYAYVSCRSFRINLWQNKEACLYRLNSRTGLIEKEPIEFYNERLYIKLFDVCSDYFLYLPDREYKTVTLRSNSNFYIGNNEINEFLKAKQLSIQSSKGIMIISANADKLDIENEKDISVKGTFNVIKMISSKGDIKGDIKISSKSRKPSITATAKCGLINLKIEGIKINLISRFTKFGFKRNLNTIEEINNKKVAINAYSYRGVRIIS